LAAERSVLGAVLIQPEQLPALRGILTAGDFYRVAHGLVWRAYLELADSATPIDPMTLRVALERAGALDDVGGPIYLAGLTDGVPRAMNSPAYAAVIRQHAQARRVLAALGETTRAVREHGATADVLAPLTAALTTPEAPIDLAVSHERRVAAEMLQGRARREAARRLDAEDRGPTPTPEILTLTQLLAEPDPIVRWRIAGWQPAGTRVMLAAARKSGKTTLVGSLVRALVDGDPWLGRDAVVPVTGTVAILDTEMARGQIRGWLRDQRIRHTDRVHVAPLRGLAATLDLTDGARRAHWCAWLRDRDVQYLVLDCLRPVLDAIGLDESREAGRYLVALDALLREAAIAEGCIVHHMGHNGDRSRGDSRLRDWPDVEWRLMREDPEQDASPRYLAAYGRDVEQPEARLDYDALTRRLTVAGGTRQDARLAEALGDVLAALQVAAGPLTATAIETACHDAGTTHGRDRIRAAVAYGIRTAAIVVRPGPHRARLHECASTRESADSAPRTDAVSARVRGVPIGTRTRALGPDASEAEVPRDGF